MGECEVASRRSLSPTDGDRTVQTGPGTRYTRRFASLAPDVLGPSDRITRRVAPARAGFYFARCVRTKGTFLIVAARCPVCGEPVCLDRSTYQNSYECPLRLPSSSSRSPARRFNRSSHAIWTKKKPGRPVSRHMARVTATNGHRGSGGSRLSDATAHCARRPPTRRLWSAASARLMNYSKRSSVT